MDATKAPHTGERELERCTHKTDRSSHRAESKPCTFPDTSAHVMSFARDQKGNHVPEHLLARTSYTIRAKQNGVQCAAEYLSHRDPQENKAGVRRAAEH